MTAQKVTPSDTLYLKKAILLPVENAVQSATITLPAGVLATSISLTTGFITKASHGLNDGDRIQFSDKGTVTGIMAGEVLYYVRNKTTNTFQISDTSAGPLTVFSGASTTPPTYQSRGTVFNTAAHGLLDNDIIEITSAGTMLGISAGQYYCVYLDANTFSLAATVDGATLSFYGTTTTAASWELIAKQTDAVEYGTPVVATSVTVATDTITSTAHGLSDGNTVQLTDLGTVTGVSLLTKYFIVNSAANTFKLALTSGGSAINLTGTDVTPPTYQTTAVKVDRTAHGMSNGDIIIFTSVGSVTGVSINTPYYVVNKATDDFQVSTTLGGTALVLTGASTTLPFYIQKFSQSSVLAPAEIVCGTTGNIFVLPVDHQDTDDSTESDYGAVKFTVAVGEKLPGTYKKVFNTSTTVSQITANFPD